MIAIEKSLDEVDVSAVEEITASVIAPIVRRKLHVTLGAADTSQRNQDALELVSEIQVLLLSGIARCPDQNGGDGVRDLRGYAATVTANVCYQYFRTKFPVRTREANRLRYILSHRKEFAIWKDKSHHWLCGFAGWKERSSPAVVAPEIVDLGAITHGKSEREKYFAILNWAFKEAGAPLVFDDLLEIAMSALQLHDVIDHNTDDELQDLLETVPDPRTGVDEEIVSAERLNELWRAVMRLPLNHRKVLLLNLKDRHGEGLIALVPMTGTATVREIAAALGFAAEEFATIWNTLPWDDLRIGEHLGLARQQVINLRQSARAKLLRHLREIGNIGQ